jgi:hypothetical protein
MTDYDMTKYDELKPTIIQYVNLLAEFNKKLINIKNNNIRLKQERKKHLNWY